MTKAAVITLDKVLKTLTFLPDRTPHTTEEESEKAFARLSEYRDGGIFVGHYAGDSEWERHGQGDEVVLVLEGSTRLVLLIDNEEVGHELAAGQMLVVPQNVWHRFETPPAGVKAMFVTPEPTDHSIEHPQSG